MAADRLPGSGVFYIVQLVPDLEPRRLKLGHAVDMAPRMLGLLTAAPTARVLQTWPCHFTWERHAIAAITVDGCAQLRGESYDFDAVSIAVTRAEDFFSVDRSGLRPPPPEQLEELRRLGAAQITYGWLHSRLGIPSGITRRWLLTGQIQTRDRGKGGPRLRADQALYALESIIGPIAAE